MSKSLSDQKLTFNGKGNVNSERRERNLKKLMVRPPRPEDLELKRRLRERNERLARERAVISRVYVGNLANTVTCKTLALAPDSTSFAEIVFNEPTAFAVALHLNGLLLEGRAIVVCRSRRETPEQRKYMRKSSSKLHNLRTTEIKTSCDGSSLEVSRYLPLALESTLQSTRQELT